jgi:hypothetical protein
MTDNVVAIATKNPIGRPRVIESPEALQLAICDYLDTCVTASDIPTLAGLAVSMGIGNSTIDAYKDRDGYKDVLDAFLQVSEQAVIKHGMHSKNQGFCTYYLKAYFKRYDQPSSQTIIVDDRRDPDQLRLDMRRYLAQHPALMAIAQYDQQGS